MAKSKPLNKWTVVQHSGNHDPQFQNALEERALYSAAEIRRVQEAGGVVLEGYVQASDLCEKWNYPKEGMGLIPDCSSVGSFSKKKIDGLAIFIPTEEARRGI